MMRVDGSVNGSFARWLPCSLCWITVRGHRVEWDATEDGGVTKAAGRAPPILRLACGHYSITILPCTYSSDCKAGCTPSILKIAKTQSLWGWQTINKPHNIIRVFGSAHTSSVPWASTEIRRFV